MSILYPKCLLDIPEEYMVHQMIQEVQVSFEEDKGSYLIYRNEVGGITDIKALFSNDPYIEDGQVKYDENLFILEQAFNYGVTDDKWFMQCIYDMDVGDVLEYDVTIHEEEDIEYNRTIRYTLIVNEVA